MPNAALGYLTLWPSGATQPNVSTLNSDGRYKANAAIVLAGANGGVSVFVSDASNVVLDIDGYFVPAGTSSALAFYPDHSVPHRRHPKPGSATGRAISGRKHQPRLSNFIQQLWTARDRAGIFSQRHSGAA